MVKGCHNIFPIDNQPSQSDATRSCTRNFYFEIRRNVIYCIVNCVSPLIKLKNIFLTELTIEYPNLSYPRFYLYTTK